MTRTKRRIFAVGLGLAALAATLLVGASAATADPSISSKREQAQAILAQIREMDSELSHAIEAYNLANIQLDQIDADLDSNGRHLMVAKSSLGVAQAHIAKRLRALYINGDSGGAVEIILGAKSLDDLLDRLDMVERVGGQDAKVLKDSSASARRCRPVARSCAPTGHARPRSSASARRRSARSRASSRSASGCSRP